MSDRNLGPTLVGAPLLVLASLLASTASPLTSAQQQQPQFGATVARVRVDVVVTDELGRFVDDLSAGDFVLFEDGVEQQILSVQLVDLVGRRVSNLANVRRLGPKEGSVAAGSGRGDVAGGAGTDSAGNTRQIAGETTTSPSDLGAIVFFIDGMSLDMPAKARFVRAMEEMLRRTERTGVPRALYLVWPTGELDELQGLTTDVGLFLEAVGRVREASTFGTSMRSRLLELLDDMQRDRTPEAVRLKALSLEFEETSRSLETLELLARFCNALAARRGRTALVWVSTGVKLAEGGPFAVLTGLDDALWQVPHTQIAERARRLHEAANSANVSIYTIDPTLIGEQRSMGFDMRARTPATSDALSDLELQGAIEAYRDTLRNAAEETGGRAFIHWSDLDRALEEMAHDTSRFYLLTYATPDPLGDGEYHEIDVEVRRPGLEVRERRGYVDLPERERRARMIEGALALPGTITGLSVRARAYRRWSADGQPSVQLAVAVDDLWSTATDGEPSVAQPFELHGLAVRENVVVDELHQRVQPLGSSDGAEPPADAGPEPPSTAPPGPGDPLVYVLDWNLGPGDYELHLAIQDEAAGRLGAAKVSVEIPEGGADWAASDLMLVQDSPGGRRMPVIEGAARFGQTLLAYLEVAGGVRPLISGELFDAAGGSRLVQLPAVPLARDETGLHRGALRLQGIPTGEYTLQVMALDPEAGRHAVFREPLHILPAAQEGVRSTGAPGSETPGEPRMPAISHADAMDDSAAITLELVLARLSRVAELYRASVLEFTASETIREERYLYGRQNRSVDRAGGGERFRSRRARTLEFDYIFGRRESGEPGDRSDPLAGTIVDLRRERGAEGAYLTPEKVLDEKEIAGFVSNGFLWVTAFSEATRERHRFELAGTGEALGRPAFIVRFEPVPPIRRGVNGWFATVWIDQETCQLLRIEAEEPDEHAARRRLERALAGAPEAPRSVEFTTVTTTFGHERNGMRFPDTIVAERNLYRIDGDPTDRSADRYPAWRVEQTYDDYLFFNIRTEAEVRAYMLGERGGSEQ